MLELTNKWMTNSLAKKSIQTNDYIACENGKQLFIVGYGNITSSGKNTYNYIVKDASTQVVVEEGENAYLDKLTTIVKGNNPKAKEKKENAKATKNLVDEFLRLESNLKKAMLAFGEFQTLHNISTLEDVQKLQEENRNARRKTLQDARRSEVKLLERLQNMRKWARDTKRVELLQKLSDKMLEI